MQLFLRTILFDENFVSEIKEPLFFGMLKSQLWYNEIVTKSAKGTNIAKFIKNFLTLPLTLRVI